MTMADKTTAFVVVRKSWFDFVGLALMGMESQSELEAHVITGPLDDIADPRGLWIRDIESHFRRADDGSAVKMRVMIPWEYVLSVGLVDETVKLQPGFKNTTILTTS